MSDFPRAAILLCALTLLSGCATHTRESAQMRAHWAAGELPAAMECAREIAGDKSGGGDELVWLLEEGAVARANGDLKSSLKSFSRARELVDEYEKDADIMIGEEARAVLANQSYVPYRGYNYDKIMMSAYQALNRMELKDFEGAGVELKRLEFHQRDAERANRDRIEKEAEALDKAVRQSGRRGASGSAGGAAVVSPGAAAALKKVYGEDYSPSARQASKGVYVNPYAYWLCGLYFANRASDASDRNLAADMFRLANETLGGKSEFVALDLKAASDAADGGAPEPVTYVLYETGLAPIRKQVRIDIPLAVASKNLPYVGLNFPYLEFQSSYRPDLSVVSDGKRARFETLADMDEIIRREFNDRLPGVVARTLVSAGVKAGAEYAAANAAGDYGWIVSIVAGIYQALTNDADLRTWTTLPKQIKISRFPTPADGIVHVEGVPVKVAAGSTNVVLAKRTGANGRLALRTFDFSDKKIERQQ